MHSYIFTYIAQTRGPKPENACVGIYTHIYVGAYIYLTANQRAGRDGNREDICVYMHRYMWVANQWRRL